MKLRWSYVLPLLVLLSYSSSSAQDSYLYEVPYASVPPLLDGHVDFIWSKATWSEDWTDIETSEEGLFYTRMKCMWDQDYIYFLFVISDPDIRASRLVDHEPLFQFDNVLEVFLDPGGDQKDYYELQINAKGTKWELSLDRPYYDGGKPTSPDPLVGLRYAIYIDGTLDDDADKDEGWTVELQVPWSSLKGMGFVPPRQDFRANFSRVYQDDRDAKTPPQYWVWCPIGKRNIHLPHKWGTLLFKSD